MQDVAFMQSQYVYLQVHISLILLNFSLGDGYCHIVWITTKATEKINSVVKVMIFHWPLRSWL